jgi:hypothetical protein
VREFIVLAGLPEDLAEDSESELGIRGGKVQTANKAADFFFCGGGRAPLRDGVRFQVAAGTEGIEQERGQAFEVGGGSRNMLLRFRGSLGIAHEFVETDGYRLAKVHRPMLFARGYAHEPMAVAEVFVREAALLRTKKKGDAALSKMLVEWMGGLIESTDRVVQLALADGGGSDHERAILYGFGDGLELLGFGEQRRGADRGTRLAKRQFIGIHHAKMEEAEVAHGAGGGADVEWITRGHKHDTQAVRFGVGRQDDEFTAGED